MRLFFRIILIIAITLLLIIQIFFFLYGKFFSFTPQVNLIPDNYNYAVFLKSNIPQNQNFLNYNLNNAQRLFAKHEYEIDVTPDAKIIANINCNNSDSFVTILPDVRPSQFKMISDHKIQYSNNSLYVMNKECDLSFNQPKQIKDLKNNVSLSKHAFALVNKEFLNQSQNFIKFESDLIASINFKNDFGLINTFAFHSNNNFKNFKSNLSLENLSCLKEDRFYMSVKEPSVLFENTKLQDQKFLDQFSDGLQIGFETEPFLCNQNNIFNLNQNASLTKIRTKLPDNSYSSYLELDLDKIFSIISSVESSNSLVQNEQLLKQSDLFVKYKLNQNNFESYFNFLSDSFNSVIYVYE